MMSGGAEGIANQTYPQLFVNRGTAIRATPDFKLLSFREILQLHLEIPDLERFIPPDSAVGGWTKSVKTKITRRRKRSRRFAHVESKVRAEG